MVGSHLKIFMSLALGIQLDKGSLVLVFEFAFLQSEVSAFFFKGLKILSLKFGFTRHAVLFDVHLSNLVLESVNVFFQMSNSLFKLAFFFSKSCNCCCLLFEILLHVINLELHIFLFFLKSFNNIGVTIEGILHESNLFFQENFLVMKLLSTEFSFVKDVLNFVKFSTKIVSFPM